MSATDAIVIVGGGHAGGKAAIALRGEGHTGPITIVGEENHPPYERPPLSKEYLQGESGADAMLLEPADWYAEHDITLLQGVAATAIDRDAKLVQLATGDPVPYDLLLLATGSTPRRLDIPGAELALTLRRVEDSDALREAYARSGSVVIIGGGWIGLETAAAARKAGLDTTVLEYAAVPLQNVLGDELGTYFAELHRRNGVDLRTSTAAESISGTGPYVVTAGGQDITADLVVMGVGAAPNTGLAEAAGLAVDNGVTVDESFRTSDPAIYAIGDVANAHNTGLGSRLRVEHWDNAIRQGEAVAKVMLGQSVTYDWQPYFYTDQFDLGMEYVGRGSSAHDVVIRGDKDSGEFIAFWLDGDRVTAGMNVNIWDVTDDIRALIGSSVDRARLADPGVPLTEVVQA
ncbi:NAD(P)/FAD-dependent oxidoreductase [Aeromicrobium sp. 9AM]|uniref:NAD(P)/FAD-dependent oxidoreductase n=1 Tax=Aeromicrobium sp. 9AM TaxID=2653126 RepID=UPI0012EF78BA|nr:FAD-dependent oxidoreductase [Aeromicrobium sp. 9AM]VXB51256.1 Rhodocoxin reductase [Aeromicrobium sp. 9AM]